MKKVIIGGVISLIGTLIMTCIMFITGSNLVDSWRDPPGRFITTIINHGMALPMIMAILLVLLGLIILIIEYIRK